MIILVYHLSSELIHDVRDFEGLSDDDLREAAYELMIASMLLSRYSLSFLLHKCVFCVVYDAALQSFSGYICVVSLIFLVSYGFLQTVLRHILLREEK